jgi:HlyD family secretion protein
VKKTIVIIVVAALVAGGGYYYWTKSNPAAAAAEESTAKAEKATVRVAVQSTGRVVSNLDVDIKCKASGAIIKLPYDVSDAVKQGDLLLELDPVDQGRILKQAEVSLSSSKARLAISQQNLAIAEKTLETDTRRAQANLEGAQASADDAKSKAARMKELLASKLASQEDADTAQTAAVQAAGALENARVKMSELETQKDALELSRQDVKLAEAQVEADNITYSQAQDRLADTKVVAPMDGVVTARNVQIGQIIASAVSNVGGGTTVLTLSDLSHVFVIAAVDESDIGRVEVGQRVEITADAFPGKKFEGSVVRIATKGVNLSNVVTFEVKIEVMGDRKSLLKPEMTANVDIIGIEKSDILTVPVTAITLKDRKHYVNLVKADAAHEEREVQTGITDGSNTEITDGLSEGDVVVLKASSAASKFSAGQGQGPGRGPGPGGPM